MLSRTADHLFWMSRYTERAENTARLLDINYQTALLPQSEGAALAGWESMLRISELMPAYEYQYGAVDSTNVMHFMVCDENNPSSIYNCLRAARENARAVRGALTTELWETLNWTWLNMVRMVKAKAVEDDPAAFFEWVKYRSHLSRGVGIGTMLRDEAYHFYRMGTFLERCDNTARLLDVKFQVAEVATEAASDDTGMDHDFYHWSAILRSVSAFEVYRKVYRDVITPERVAELLMLRGDMPRSLLSCLNEVVHNLSQVSNASSAETERLAGRLRSELAYAHIDEIMAGGLHAYLTQFLNRINEIGGGISRDFLVPVLD